MKRIVIVGATSGIGLETARLCIRAGWRVGAAGRRQEALDALRAEAPAQVEVEALDVNHDDAPEHLARLIERLGGMECIECGCCAYGCPAGIPLVQSFRTAKRMLRDAAAREKEAAK